MFSLIPWKNKSKQSIGGGIATRDANPMVRFREEVDSLFDRFFRAGPTPGELFKGWPALTEKDWSLGWGLEVDDREDEIVVRAEAPGFDPEDFDVQLSGNRLVVHAEHKEESKKGNERSYSYGTLRRVIPLPEGIEGDKIDARYQRGVLQVHVPKGERTKVKRIAVNLS